jgi:hypothetical protein
VEVAAGLSRTQPTNTRRRRRWVVVAPSLVHSQEFVAARAVRVHWTGLAAFAGGVVCLALAAARRWSPGSTSSLLDTMNVPPLLWSFAFLPVAAAVLAGGPAALLRTWSSRRRVDLWGALGIGLAFTGLALVAPAAAGFVLMWLLLPAAAVAWAVAAVRRRRGARSI